MKGFQGAHNREWKNKDYYIKYSKRRGMIWQNKYVVRMHSKINCGVKQGCTHSTQACSVKGFKEGGF